MAPIPAKDPIGGAMRQILGFELAPRSLHLRVSHTLGLFGGLLDHQDLSSNGAGEGIA